MVDSGRLRELYRTVQHSGRLLIHLEDVDPHTLHLVTSALHYETGKRLLVVVPDEEQADTLVSNLRVLFGQENEWGPVVHLPTWFVSPYIPVSADRRRQLQALGVWSHVGWGKAKVVVCSPAPLLWRIPDPEAVSTHTTLLETGEEVDREAFIRSLSDRGYTRVNVVVEEGTFAVRGSLLDIFSPGEDWPIRVDFFGDDVEAIALFDPNTQLSKERLSTALVAPASPVLEQAQMLQKARPSLVELSGKLHIPSSRLTGVLDQLRDEELPIGMDALLPLLTDAPKALHGYLDPKEWAVFFSDKARIDSTIAKIRESERDRYHAAATQGRLVLSPEELMMSQEDAESSLARFTQLNTGVLDTDAGVRFSFDLRRPVEELEGTGNRIGAFQSQARERLKAGYRVVLTSPDAKEAQRLATQIVEGGLSCRIFKGLPTYPQLVRKNRFVGVEMFIAPLHRGFHSPHQGLYLVTGDELYVRRARRTRKDSEGVSDRERLLELKEGDYVVHKEYGIGQFQGVARRTLGTAEYMSLVITYANSDTLYVPVHNAGAIQRYVGSSKGAPKMDRLGGVSWEKRVSKVKTAAKKLAVDLLALYARRQALSGYAYSPADEYYEEFEAAFPYNETPDQQRVIEEVLLDMEKPQPMDRLVCGDVGFGKTEVAIRAAFKAILDGRQVAVLVPTTVLAEQHRMTFQQRLKRYPVKVASLSRFKSKRQQKETLKELERGDVDVIIGTHRLLGKDVNFKQLGLVVIDEEHRFGVNHKERLKALRSTVDVLSMTATPIPRTLHMAMTGVRDLSLIKTPPPGRQDIETSLIHFDEDFIRDVIQRELDRDGQIFFLHNRVEDILNVKATLEGIVPGVRVAVAHGQMGEGELEKAMLQFMAREFDVLLCTTIIESGLDIPTVNTLFVNNADYFGLAQLYQIRGRIGRGNRKAYAYFIVPPTSVMSTEARSRLAALTKFSAVGSGFQIASIDMELRGAGDLLGANQSGHIASVGFDLYVHMLQEAVDDLKAQREEKRAVESRVEIPVEASIPDSYIPDRHERLVFYRMVAASDNLDLLDRYRFEMRDRFGPLPDPVQQLLAVAELRLRCQKLGISHLVVGTQTVKVHLEESPDAVLAATLELIKKQPLPLRVTPTHHLIATFPTAEMEPPVNRARRILGLIEGELKVDEESTSGA